MIGKVKKWLGIEGVKVEVHPEEPLNFGASYLRGHVIFRSMRPGKVLSIYINIKEVYTRGRRKNRRTDEYLMGETTMYRSIDIPVDEEISVPFELELDWYESEMDELQQGNAISRPFVRLAKWLKGVRSSYILTTEAQVEGTKLHPFDQKELEVTN